MVRLVAFDCDNVLKGENESYQRCVIETIEHFINGESITKNELIASLKTSNDDWLRVQDILKQHGVNVDYGVIREHFQDLYLGVNRDFSGYVNNEPWLVDNSLLRKMARFDHLTIVSGGPQSEIRYALNKHDAQELFPKIWGVDDCNGKDDGLEQALNYFGTNEVYFCDDRPYPIIQASKLVGVNGYDVQIFGILPPNAPKDWGKVLMEAGAVEVFHNVNKYCEFVLSNSLSN